MKKIRGTELAKKLKISSQAISRACRNGELNNISKTRIVEIDLEDPRTKSYVIAVSDPHAVEERRQKSLEQNKPKTKVQKKKEPKEAKTKTTQKKSVTSRDRLLENLKTDFEDEEELSQERNEGVNTSGKYNRELDRLKAQTRKINIEIAQKMDTLLPKEQVDKVFGELYSIILNFFFPVGDRLSSSIAGVFGVLDVTKLVEVKDMIDKEIMRGLGEFKKGCEKLTRVDEDHE